MEKPSSNKRSDKPTESRKKGKVLMALSGGIDSAVSAYLLLKQGYEVEAAFMKNWSSTEGLLKNECPWLTDRQDALRVAAFLKIPFHTIDFEKKYRDTVMKYFFAEYKAGHTPNPDVMCNKEIKFKLLYNWAKQNGFDYLATGHYARIAGSVQRRADRQAAHSTLNAIRSTLQLVRSSDEFKDQTYFIYNIKPEQLPYLLFPIGGMKKASVRKLAQKIGLPNADKKESMGLCFVGKIRLKDFLEQQLKLKKGPIMDMAGKVIGEHEGLYNYTIGQRQGIKVGASGPYYVVKKDLKANTLTVTNNPDDPVLKTKHIQLHSVNWIGSPAKGRGGRGEGVVVTTKSSTLHPTPYTLVGRFRHQGELVPLSVTQIDTNLYNVEFSKSQKALASGQSLVLYKGKICVGGGVIV